MPPIRGWGVPPLRVPFLYPDLGVCLEAVLKATGGLKVIVFMLHRFRSPMKSASETLVCLGFLPDLKSVTTPVTTLPNFI